MICVIWEDARCVPEPTITIPPPLALVLTAVVLHHREDRPIAVLIR